MVASKGTSVPVERPDADTLYERSAQTVVRRSATTGHFEVSATIQDQCLTLGGFQRVHEMSLTLTVRQQDWLITRAEADMSAHPHGACPSTISDVQRIVGLRIAGGFNAELRQRLGGTRSCNHLHTMAQNAAQTMALSHVSTLYEDDPVLPESGYAPFYRRVLDIAPRVVNTCAVWATDGPVVGDLRSSAS